MMSRHLHVSVCRAFDEKTPCEQRPKSKRQKADSKRPSEHLAGKQKASRARRKLLMCLHKTTGIV